MMHLALACALVQEKVTLELKAREGYHYRVTKRQTEESDLTVRHGKDKPTRQRTTARTEHIFSETVLGVHNGQATKVERRYERAHDDFSDLETSKTASRDLSFAGKSAVLELTEQGTSVEQCDPGITARDLNQLQMKPDPITGNLPTGGVAVGEEWTVPAGALTAEFKRQLPGFTVDAIDGRAKLERVETWNQQRCGVINAVVDLTARSPEGPTVTIRTDATMWLNLDRGVVVRIDAVGKQTLGGSAEARDHGRFDYDGSATSKYTEEIVWLD